jgi:hypothetical protein
MKKLLLLPCLAAASLSLAACDKESPAVPPIPVTDTKPLGDGLKVIGFALIGASVVITLGRLLR